MMRRWLVAMLALGCMLLVAGSTFAETVLEVDAGPVLLEQIWPQAPAEVAELELGSAPPAGSSRLILRRDIVHVLAQAGAKSDGLKLPSAVRIKTRSEHWRPERLRSAATQAAARVLPEGVSLRKVKVSSRVTVPEGTRAGRLSVGKLPRREGEVTVPAVLELVFGDVSVRRVPLALVLHLDARAAQPLISQGAVLQVFIEKRSATVAAPAEALQDADVGDVIQFRIRATRRVVRAMVESATHAKVML